MKPICYCVPFSFGSIQTITYNVTLPMSYTSAYLISPKHCNQTVDRLNNVCEKKDTFKQIATFTVDNQNDYYIITRWANPRIGKRYAIIPLRLNPPTDIARLFVEKEFEHYSTEKYASSNVNQYIKSLEENLNSTYLFSNMY